MARRAIGASLALLTALVWIGGTAAASEPTQSVDELMAIIGSDAAIGERKQALEELTDGNPKRLDELRTFLLDRKRKSSPDARRAVLRGIGAAVPDKKGKFRNPGRQKQSQKDKQDASNWMPKLLELDTGKPAVAETITDVAAIRGLAAIRDHRAGDAIFETAFSGDTMVYRDECGRYMRKMAPYSLPALVTRAAIRKKYSSARRYAKYQLERLDLESPKKALRSAAGDERLLIALLETYGTRGYRPAVAQVLAHTNHDTASVRAAARKGWEAYITGKAPEAPKRKLVQPGGKFSDKEQPLYLNYQELARIELRRTYEEVMGEPPARKASLKEMSKALFDKWDGERAAHRGKMIDAALAQAADGKLKEATAALDRLLALDEKTDRGAEIARVYSLRAKQLEEAGEWRAAARAFHKVHALAPDADGAADALASHYVALGKAVEAEGGDPRPLYAKAKVAEPSHSGARKAAGDGGGKPRWMLYAGGGGAALAVILLVIGLVIRRQ
jgi:hypothetical protein